MRSPVYLLALALLSVTFAVPAHAEDSKKFSDADKAAIGDIIKDYLTKEHPEVVMQAVQELQKRDQETADAKSKQAMSGSKDKLFNDADTPVGGNPKGDVTVVEFFDYQCGYCKMSEEAVEKLLKEDKNVKFIYKEYPILGPASRQAALAAIASVRQGKYDKFHAALMNKKDHLTDDIIYAVAKDVGLDVDKVKKDMEDKAVIKIVDDALQLGQDVGVRGTPMFIIGDKVNPGAMQYDAMKKAVDDARSAKKK